MTDLPLHLQRDAHRLHHGRPRRLARILTHLNGFIFSAILPAEPQLVP
ncbi:MAG: hypothetical protein ACR2KV_04315 [Solirubrobacteraceae bacterium]